MNFFESQDRARRKTGQLIFLFALAVLSLIGLTNLGLYALSNANAQDAQQLAGIGLETHLLVSGSVLVIIGVASLFKIAALASGGGAGVATSLGGRLIHADTTDTDERRVLNVVEEMAIASGIPVPPVYVLDDDAINAFAAGFHPHDAVLGLTRGSVRFLTRDELQGVIAHEFSHILHGDMRINIRLMGVLYGITLIGSIGYFLLRSGSYSRSSSRDNNGAAAIVIAGLGLTIIGYAGTFFGNLIKASVSRQREYLADASAVQYTRNPDGIANALKKIGGFRFGSKLMTGNAAEASHLFIGQAVKLSSLMATHPPLKDRIQRLQPDWDGDYLDIEQDFREAQRERHFTREQASAAGISGLAAAVAIEQSVLESVGQIDEKHIDYAQNLLLNMRRELREAMRQVDGARSAIFCLLIDQDDEIKERQLQSIATMEGESAAEQAQQLLPMVQSLGIEYRIPIIDLAMPVLKTQYEDQYLAFRKTLLALMQADQRIDLFEWCLHRMLLHHLDAEFGRKTRQYEEQNDIADLRDECELLLATLARTGAHGDAELAQLAYSKGLVSLELPDSPLPSDDSLRLKELDAALQELLALPPLQKPRLIKACAASVLADGVIHAQEFELLRAVADSLDVPLPPRLAQQDLV
jgi:Zn-dependent protease with chaperone function/uncharacterized tellurite resistance protein B-like protein